MLGEIVLIRHGRSRHVQSGWINCAEFLRWREAYEAAGIDDTPPPQLCAAAVANGILVSSTAQRAIESANALCPRREIVISPLLIELDLHPPEVHRIRLPLLGWALTYGLWSLVRPHVTADEERRTRAATEWLCALVEKHGNVVAVTHASFRSLLSRELVRRGWRCTVPRRKSDHWSAWSFTRTRSESERSS